MNIENLVKEYNVKKGIIYKKPCKNKILNNNFIYGMNIYNKDCIKKYIINNNILNLILDSLCLDSLKTFGLSFRLDPNLYITYREHRLYLSDEIKKLRHQGKDCSIYKKLKLKFKAKMNNLNFNNLYFRIYTGVKWIQINKLITNEFQEFELEDNFSFTHIGSGLNSKFRIGINSDFKITDTDTDTDTDINLEITNIELLDISEEISEKNNKEINFYIYSQEGGVSFHNLYDNIIWNYIYQNYNNIQISLYSYEDINKNMGEADIIYLDDPNLNDIKNIDYLINIINKFPKNNRYCCLYDIAVRINNEYSDTHNSYIENNFYPLFTNIFTQEIKKDSKFKWFPLSSCLGYFYEDIKIVQVEKCKKEYFSATNPFSHGGKDGKRINIITNLLNHNLDLHLYGRYINDKNLYNHFCKYGNKNKGLIKADMNDMANKALSKLNILNKYKFIIVCENICNFPSFTEKLLDIIIIDSIPIYFGYKYIDKIFPFIFEMGVINGFSFESYKDLVSYLNNMSDDEYNIRIKNIKKNREILLKTSSIFSRYSFFFGIIENNIGINPNYSEGAKELIKINEILY